ncbi:MAG: CDP-alcohol phosphatidyltransferase family protein [Nitrospirota bacterium]|nr:CDP-alcohol phosphatidyltransferase family protein [Nitrospirota bacterium]
MSMDGILKQETTDAVDTAILLTSSGVFASGSLEPGEALPSPLMRVGGMTLFQRAVFTLQRGGISQIWVLAGKEEPMLRELLREDSRLQAAVRWLPVREFPPHDPQTWEALADEISGACMVVGCHTIFSPSLVQRLRQEGAQGKAVVVVGQEEEGYHAGNPGVMLKTDGVEGGTASWVMFRDPPMASTMESASLSKIQNEPRLSIVGDLIVLPGRLLGISGVLHASGTNPLRLALEQAAVEGTVQTIPGATHWFRDVRGPKGGRLAEQTLVRSLQTLKGGMDGLVDRYVNRKCSGLLTRLFLKLRWTPNTITILSMVVGLVAAGFFIPGSWEYALIGALLFQLSVIIDCCDGEVARLTFAESKFGQELDIWADNVVHIAIFAGIACGAYLQGPWEQTHLPLILGASAVLANVVSLLLVNAARHLRSHSTDFRRLTDREREKIEFLLGNVANRDFSLVVLIGAGLGFLHWFLALAAIGSWFFVMSLAWLLRRNLTSRA